MDTPVRQILQVVTALQALRDFQGLPGIQAHRATMGHQALRDHLVFQVIQDNQAVWDRGDLQEGQCLDHQVYRVHPDLQDLLDLLDRFIQVIRVHLSGHNLQDRQCQLAAPVIRLSHLNLQLLFVFQEPASLGTTGFQVFNKLCRKQHKQDR